MKAKEYNQREASSGRLTFDHLTEAVKIVQSELGLEVDGKAGPRTREALELSAATRNRVDDTARESDLAVIRAAMAESPLTVSSTGWLIGDRVRKVPADPSWYGGLLKTGQPQAVIWHYSATGPRTAENMARRRAENFYRYAERQVRAGNRRPGKTSWHVTIDKSGVIWQQVPLDHVAHHAGGSDNTGIPGLGHPNLHAVGVELEGFGDEFPIDQVCGAARFAAAVAAAYPIVQAHAVWGHSQVNSGKSDPGPLWEGRYLPLVIQAAYC